MLKLASSISPVSLATLQDSDHILGLAKSADTVKAAIAESRTLAAMIDDLAISSANRALVLRRFQAAIIAAFIVAKHEAIKSAIQETLPGVWPKVKDAYSKALKLANAIHSASFPVPEPTAKTRKRITVAGRVVTTLDKSHLPALADPLFGDTPVSTLISKVIEAEPETGAAEPEGEAEVLEANASDAFMLELRRRCSDPVMFAELLPVFDVALATHTGKGTAEDMVAAEPQRMVA